MKDLRNRHFDLIAFAYDRLIGRPNTNRFSEMLGLPVPGRLLDAGGGTGRVSSSLRPFVGGVVVADLSAGMLRHAKAKGGIDPVRTRTEALPFADGVFARVIVIDALHHFSRMEQAIAELVRVLAPGGRILIEEPDLTLFVVKLVAIAEKLMLMESHFRTPEAIASVIEKNGLSPSIRHSGHFRSWITADKPG